ncbi:MAG: hypothetical protein M1829_003999 [Trizodia sp. TS-e1964]|nr:MAG: hypothetical protein M1829_003999 [Trizodia sp. TS-e1964]
MGWFGSSTPSPPKPTPSPDGAFIAPDRGARARCWEGRDAFFACLDANDILDAEKHDKEAREKCAAQLRAFEMGCASSWVVYFKKWRVADAKKKMAIKQMEAEGATSL